MRVAFVVSAFPVPSETFVSSQIAGVAARGHEVDIYATGRIAGAVGGARCSDLARRVRYVDAPRGVRRFIAAGGAIARAGWRSPRLCARALNIFRYRRDALTLGLVCAARPFLIDGARDYDVVHCQFGPLGRVALRLRQIGALRGALVTSFRGYDATQYLRRQPHAYDELFREGELFLPVSRELKSVLIARGAPPGKIEVHRSGVDCAKFLFHARTREPGAPTRIVSVGRLVEKKGIEYAIRAVARLVDSGHALSYEVLGDGPRRAPLERLVDELSMHAHIRLLGWRAHTEIAAKLAQAHLLIAPSVTAVDGDQEGIANVLKEAMASGMPVVATAHGGTAELVEDGVSGFLVPERDVDALARRIGDLIARPERWPAMGRAGRARVEAAFDLHALTDELERLYQRLAGGRDTRSDARVPWPACAADKA